MTGGLAWTTHDAEFAAVSVGGRPVAAAWSQIARHLARQVSPAHAALFAEPSPDPARSSTDWFASGEGPSLALDETPAMIPRFEALVRDIRTEADRLISSRDETERLLGEMLAAALEIPDRTLARVRGDAVFLVAWGHRRAGRASGAELIRSLPGTRLRIPLLRLVRPVPPRHWPWMLLAAALLLLLLAIGMFLAWRDPFGWRAPPLAQCEIDPADLALLDTLDAAQAEEVVLRDRLAQIALEAGRRRLACPPLAPPVPPPATPPAPVPGTPPSPQPQAPPPRPTPPPNPDVERANRAGAQRGALQIILAWDDVNDLDLYVVCPNGQVLGPDGQAACGGRLDVDANGGGGVPSASTTRTPVETAFWTSPAPGRYRVHVNACCVPSLRVPEGSRFRVTIRQVGRPDRTVTGFAARPGPEGTPGDLVTEVVVP